MKDYLFGYAEPEAGMALKELEGFWDEAVVLPLCGEENPFPTLISLDKAAASHEKRLLQILVVNAREDASSDRKRINTELLASLEPKFGDASTLYRVDRTTPGRCFPPGEGVGLARKLGADIAVGLAHAGRIAAPLIHTTDGDAEVDLDYFTGAGSGAAGGVHRYTHSIGPGDSNHALYEIWLRHYDLGVRSAGSPYAFPTLGSTIAFSPRAYAAVRGFPKLLAAEDFYFLNKLLKVGPIVALPGRVRLRPRPSDRVPFGTGAGTAKIDREGEIKLYRPEIFAWLREWIESANQFVEHRSVERVREQCARHTGLTEVLRELRAFEALEVAARTRPDCASLARHVHTWFDAFRTLKFVHVARDKFLPSFPLEHEDLDSMLLDFRQRDESTFMRSALP